MKTRLRRPARKGRKGIALIIVLGFLALMMVMAVGFAVSMRVERLATRNYLDVVRARELIWAGLSRAVTNIDVWVGPRMIPAAPGVRVSENPGGGVGAGDLLDGAVSSYFPSGVYDRARSEVKARCKWEVIQDAGVGALGSVAYAIVDVSGLVDINRDHHRLPTPTNLTRFAGASPLEIDGGPTIFPEFTGSGFGTTLSNFCVYASQHMGRVETVAELAAFGITDGLLQRQPSSFVTYSRFPMGWVQDNTVGDTMPIGNLGERLRRGEADAVLSELQTTFRRALSAIGANTAGADDLARQLIDYVDEDDVPGGTLSMGGRMNMPSVEAVPTLNEIVAQARFTGSNYEYQVWGELAYPFALRTNNSTVKMRLYTKLANGNVNNGASAINGTYDITGVTWTTLTFRSFGFPGPPGASSWQKIEAASGAIDPSLVTITAYGDVTIGGVQYDLLPQANGVVFKLNDILAGRKGWGADDCRINWDGKDSNQWRAEDTPQVTLDAVNHISISTYTNKDGSPLCYCPNTNLSSVGEIGYLLQDRKPWETVRLTGDRPLPVFAYFSLHTNKVLHGLVNPNTTNVSALAAVLNNCPVQRVPGGWNSDDRYILSEASAMTLARALINATPVSSNMGDLAASSAAENAIQTALAGVVGGTPDRMQVESVVRNSGALISPRQNLFLIVVGARAHDRKVNDMPPVPLAEQRAVALVWRDPYPINGRHAVIVRHLKWLSE